jgi:hypothetical protein
MLAWSCGYDGCIVVSCMLQLNFFDITEGCVLQTISDTCEILGG